MRHDGGGEHERRQRGRDREREQEQQRSVQIGRGAKPAETPAMPQKISAAVAASR